MMKAIMSPCPSAATRPCEERARRRRTRRAVLLGVVAFVAITPRALSGPALGIGGGVGHWLVAVSPDRRWVALEDWDAAISQVTVRAMDQQRGRAMMPGFSIVPSVCGAAWAPTGARLLLVSRVARGSSGLLVHDVRESRSRRIAVPGRLVGAPAVLSPDGAYVAAGLAAGGKTVSAAAVFRLEDRRAQPWRIEFPHDAQWMCWVSARSLLVVTFGLSANRTVPVQTAHLVDVGARRTRAVALSPATQLRYVAPYADRTGTALALMRSGNRLAVGDLHAASGRVRQFHVLPEAMDWHLLPALRGNSYLWRWERPGVVRLMTFSAKTRRLSAPVRAATDAVPGTDATGGLWTWINGRVVPMRVRQ